RSRGEWAIWVAPGDSNPSGGADIGRSRGACWTWIAPEDSNTSGAEAARPFCPRPGMGRSRGSCGTWVAPGVSNSRAGRAAEYLPAANEKSALRMKK
ncbi:MAG: hypothetical protein PHC36_09225, partial [Eubacteriales bacterium]|nr:hypothetical protein [Eubacteriales bacterium]